MSKHSVVYHNIPVSMMCLRLCEREGEGGREREVGEDRERGAEGEGGGRDGRRQQI